MAALGDITRALRTLRHLKGSQIYWRARYTLERRLPQRAYSPRIDGFDTTALGRLRAYVIELSRHATPKAARLEELRQGRFTFLNETAETGGMPPWDCPEKPKLWQYQAHYFDYLRDMALASVSGPRTDDARRCREWVTAWIERHSPGRGVAWEAFPMSCRLIHWAIGAAVFGWDDAAIATSMGQQLECLRRRIEYDVRANHLLKNATALCVAGACLRGETATQARRIGERLLEAEMAEQVGPDGAHYERSLMYHAHVLEDLLTAHAVCAGPPAYLGEAIARMAAYLEAALHPDGAIPLFGDAALDAGTPPGALISLARERCGPARAEPAGLWVMGAGAARMIVKGGEPGPPYQLGHAHADFMSYELSVNGRRVIVDSGVREYAEGSWREYARSVRAHNGVQVDGREPMECWGAFRVGRRYRVLEWKRETGEDWAICRGSHDGFHPYVHERRVRLVKNDHWVITDRIKGPGACEAVSFIHAHPDFEFRGAGGVFYLSDGATAVTIVPLEIEQAEIIRGQTNPLQGWYAPDFGVSQPTSVLALRKAGASPMVFGYAIFPHYEAAPDLDGLKLYAEDEGPVQDRRPASCPAVLSGLALSPYVC